MRLQSVLAGQTPVFHNVLPRSRPHIAQGTIRALRCRARRLAVLPRHADAGRGGIRDTSRLRMVSVVAAGTPQPIVDTLSAQVRASSDCRM